jgi:hypothetical protein
MFVNSRLSQGVSGVAQRGSRRVRAGRWLDEARRGHHGQRDLRRTLEPAGASAIEAVMAEMHRIDHAMSPHKPDSELLRINREAATGPLPVSAEMAQLLSRADEFAQLSGGAFDITWAIPRPPSAGCTTIASASVRPTPPSPRRAPRWATDIWSSTCARAPCASRARAGASIWVASRRARRWTTRQRSWPAVAVVLKLTIAPSGGVVECRLESSELRTLELEAKLLARIRQFDFGAKDVDQMIVTWPVDFLPS